MSGVSEYMLHLESLGLSGLKDAEVCNRHIDDYAIRDFISSKSKTKACSYCKARRTVSFEVLLTFIMRSILRHYTDAAEFMPYDSSEGGYLGPTYGPDELIDDIVGLDINSDQLREDIISCIDDRAWSDPETFHDSEREILYYHWHFFTEVVKHQSRYFFPVTKRFKTFTYKQNAFDILLEIGKQIKSFQMIRTIRQYHRFYRCRQHRTHDEVSSMKDIAAPPNDKAVQANRMSPSGISMFYAAFDETVAVSETLDLASKDKRFFTTGLFTNRKPLRVIDFTKLPRRVSMFDLKLAKSYNIVGFLHDFVNDLIKPISHDGAEHIDYVPTQVVTEYFRFFYSDVEKMNIDGVIYPSSRKKGEAACVLFLNHEESMEELKLDPSSLKTKVIP